MEGRAAWEQWRHSRFDHVTAPDGIAAATSTTWLTSGNALAIPGLPGEWIDRDGTAVRIDTDPQIELTPGTELTIGTLVVRTLVRDGLIALRVFDPEAPSRVLLAGIDAFDYDPAWVITGQFRAVTESIAINRADGAVTRDRLAGLVQATVDGHQVQLVALPLPGDHALIPFADTTNASLTQQFRFLEIDITEESGAVELDFNRAHLPPCAFADHYLCPLPPPENRLPVDIRAGETRRVLVQ
nr:hypothetical protein ISGA_3421 [Gordonia sp. NB41Y]